jgi:hypothetical protein
MAETFTGVILHITSVSLFLLAGWLYVCIINEWKEKAILTYHWIMVALIILYAFIMMK